MSGSSMAVPYVSGIAALLYSCHEGLYPAAVREWIFQTAFLLPYQEDAFLPSSMSFAEGKLIIPGVPDLYAALSSHELPACDITAPVLSVTSSYTTDFLRLTIHATDTESGIRVLRYAKGTKTLRAFQRGIAGTAIDGNNIRLAKEGTYTIYASDYAGNETILRYRLTDDKTPPQILPTLHSSPSGKLHRLIAELSDTESGIAAVYLAMGEYTTDDFPFDTAQSLSAVNNRINLYLSTPGSYTMYAKDTRGNTSTVTIVFPAKESDDTEETTLE